MIIRDFIKRVVEQDIGFQDITSQALIPKNLKVKAQIKAKEEGLLAGGDLAAQIFSWHGLHAVLRKSDGEWLQEDDIILEIEGNARSILSLERTVLNLLMRMSGIATITSKMVKDAKSVNNDIIIAGTRKTTPGIQLFEKEAIRIGGGDTHRFRLDDGFLIKDNHLAIVGDVKIALKKAKNYASFTKKIEIEVDNVNDALDVAKCGADIILLDNLSPEKIIEIISVLEDENLREKVLIEASGGINPKNVMNYARTGVDILSSGYLTHSAKALDMSLSVLDS